MNFDELVDNDLPYNLDAEQTVLGSILIDPHVISTILEFLTAKSFYVERHRELFSIMMQMFTSNQTADTLTVLEEALKNRRVYETYGCMRQYNFNDVDISSVKDMSDVNAYYSSFEEKE